MGNLIKQIPVVSSKNIEIFFINKCKKEKIKIKGKKKIKKLKKIFLKKRVPLIPKLNNNIRNNMEKKINICERSKFTKLNKKVKKIVKIQYPTKKL